MANDDKAWFAPKRHGFGSGMPIAWQGWAILGLYLLVVIAATFLVERRPLAFWAILFIATAALLAICAAKTRGGWRWRAGRDD